MSMARSTPAQNPRGPAGRQEVVADARRAAGPERGLRVGVVLVDGLEAGFEGAVEGTTARGAERKDRDPQPHVEELEVTLVARALQIELRAVAALGREDVRALLERLLRVEGPRGRRVRRHDEERGPGEQPRSSAHGSINTFSASPLAIRLSACRTASRRIRCVMRPSGASTPDSISSTARRINSGVWWNAPTSVSSS